MRYIATTALLLAILAPATLHAQVLKGEELKAAIAGKSGTFRTKDGKVSGTVSYDANGTARTSGNFPGFSEDTGTWSFKGDQLCAKWKKIRKGAEACFTLKRLPDGSIDFGNNTFKPN